MEQDKYTWSFEGQDRILMSLFRNFEKGIYVDVGCNDPKINNNTYALYEMGWRGYGIDGSNEFEELWRENRPRDKYISAVISNHSKNINFYKFTDNTNSTGDENTFYRYKKRLGDPVSEEIVRTTTLEEIFDTVKLDHNFNLLTIDVEGMDYEAIQGLNLHKYRPQVILVELGLFQFDHPFQHQIVSHLYDNNYCLIAKTPYDAFFVSKENNLGWIPSEML